MAQFRRSRIIRSLPREPRCTALPDEFVPRNRGTDLSTGGALMFIARTLERIDPGPGRCVLPSRYPPKAPGLQLSTHPRITSDKARHNVILSSTDSIRLGMNLVRDAPILQYLLDAH